MNSPLNSTFDIEASEARIRLEVDGLAPDALVPERVHLTEALSTLYEARVFCLSMEADLDLDLLVAADALLRVRHPAGQRLVHGIVRSIRSHGISHGFACYELVLVPRMWLLGCMHGSRIFQDMSVPEIVVDLLEGVDAVNIDLRLASDHTPRNFCVQYRETQLAFVCRLLEDEGMYFFFEHDEDGHIIVITDDTVHCDMLHDLGGTPMPLRFHLGGMSGGDDPCVTDLQTERRIRPGTAILNDYSFKRPDDNLLVSDSEGLDADLESYDYPGNYTEASLGRRLVQLRYEELQVRRAQVRGRSDLPDLAPGLITAFAGHPRADLNGEFLLLEVAHVAAQSLSTARPVEDAPYQCTFVALPVESPYRPPRVTPRPRIDGLQTAVVTGPPGEEIHVDAYGRIKVQFHWDREGIEDETSSCWIRVSRPWTGADFGHQFNPRIGAEVVVQFLEGDPDRPVVTGMLFNDTHMPPYALPDNATQSGIKTESTPGGGGSNEIRFEDAKGSEELYLHAQKDYTLDVENDATTTVGASATTTVGHNRSVTVTDDNTLTVSNGNHTASVSTGTSTTTVKGAVTETYQDTLTTTVTSDIALWGQANRSLGIAGDSNVQIDGSELIQVGDTQTFIVTNEMQLLVGGSTIFIHKSGAITITGSTNVKVESAAIQVEASGACLVTGSEVDVQGDTVTVEGSTVNVQGDTVNIDGSTVNVDATGNVNANGALVKLTC